MHDGCATKEDLQAQADRYHRGQNDIARSMGAMQVTLETLKDHLVGTLDKPGLAHRVSALESKSRVAWWSERGTKVVDALILGIVVSGLVILLKLGFQGAIRQEIREARDELSLALEPRKAPKDPACPGCAPTVATAE